VKKILMVLFAATFLIIPPAHADGTVIRIVDKPHLNFEGKFRDNELAVTLLPNGKLGKLIYGINSAHTTFIIDAALIDEITAMAQGYTFEGKEDLGGKKSAQNWLFRLKITTSNNKVVVLPYGNPDEKLLKLVAPSELQYYLKYAQARLESNLGRLVDAETGWVSGRSYLLDQYISGYSDNRRLLTGLSTITSSEEVTDLRARLAIVMNPLLDKGDRAYFSYSEKGAVEVLSSRLKVIPGRYQITSSSAKLPITLVNNFDTISVVNISFIPMNSRIHIENINNVSIAAKSRQQILVPVDVVAPGNTLVLAQFTNSKGRLVGKVSKLNITSTVIDPRVAWFTTGAAVLLFLGAVTQSVRRIRKSRV